MANMPYFDKALDLNDGTAQLLGNKLMYAVTSKLVTLSLTQARHNGKSGGIENFNAMESLRTQREADNMFWDEVGIAVEPEDEILPFLVEGEALEFMSFRHDIFMKRVYRQTFNWVLQSRKTRLCADITHEDIEKERKNLEDQGRSSCEVAGLSDDYFINIIKDNRKGILEYYAKFESDAEPVFMKWQDSIQENRYINGIYPLPSDKVIVEFDRKAFENAFKTASENGLNRRGNAQKKANANLILLKGLKDAM
tara:strand:- start:168 stop:926 length:759 start_codon:yes stop_codon:yes gene_type:complete